ncbi:uncharacterized protein LOC122034018 [Zingiber officinale]|uniref:uncharacterized protein LOC122034018 n=1 Tax=Zingiber officinale TaxID=94328 RepID=UPI001C4CF7B8|nr:uncharacterized protein LOC122034018 [Zingiber officinale]
MNGKDLPWYSCYLSDLDPHDLSVVQSLLRLDPSYELRLPSPNEHPSSPPEGCITVFKDQIMGGLRFPLHPFISDLCQHCGIGVSQFAPNVFRAICGTVILCRIYRIPLTPHLFQHFYSFRRAEAGIFNVQAKPGFKFFDSLPSSNKGWRSRFFFLKPPSPLAGPSQWRPLPAFPPHVHESACFIVADKLTGVLVRLSVLMLEGILYTFGLSPVPAEIGAPFAAAILRSFACQETPAVAVLEALHQELTPGLPSDPAAALGPQLPAPPTSDVVIVPPLLVLPSPSAADPALSHTSDQPATASSPTRQAPPLRPTLRLRVTRNSKRTAPVTATSPPPSQRQRVVVLSSPSKSSGTSSAQEPSSGQE